MEEAVKNLIMKYLTATVKENIHADSTKENKVLIPFDISGLWFPLGDLSYTEKANALAQWNDAWLMTVLKQIYYTEYYRNMNITVGTSEYKLRKMLSELLKNTKSYYSIIKRGENFKFIDDEVKRVLAENKEIIDELVFKIQHLSKELNENDSEQSIILDINGSLLFIKEIFDKIVNASKGFLLSFISRRHLAIKIDSFEEFIKQIIDVETHKVFTNIKYYDTIALFKNISIGLDNPIYFYDHNLQICALDDVSGVSDILRVDADYLPVLYIYIFLWKMGMIL